MWNREHRIKPPANETPQQKKERQAKTRKKIVLTLLLKKNPIDGSKPAWRRLYKV